jgi:hypothetical protein
MKILAWNSQGLASARSSGSGNLEARETICVFSV